MEHEAGSGWTGSPAQVSDDDNRGNGAATPDPVAAGNEGSIEDELGTGDERVDAALRLLDRLPGLPVSEHPQLFEQVHAQLSEVLGELESGSVPGPAGRYWPALAPMSRRLRLDAELVRRGLARSRDQAADLIGAGRVAVGGQTAAKAASQVSVDAAITVGQPSDRPDYVSRGGHKLAGALAAFTGLQVAGQRCLDAGASTGGFTDVLLRAGAAHVVAVDVGYGQLAWSLQTDPRVTVLDRVNIRSLTPDQVAPAPEVVVADLSFISLTLVLPALVACAAPDADFVVMVKPQFEVGRELVGSGVVKDPELRFAAVTAVAAAAAGLHLGVAGVTASPLPGPSGNVEYFLWLRRGAPELDEQRLRQAIAAGPR